MKLAFGLAVLVTACTRAAQTSQDVKNKRMPAFLRQLADTRKTIADGYVHWTDALKAKDLNAVVALYADDATVLPDEKDAVSGKEGIRAFYSDWFSKTDKLIEQKFENINSVQEGDLLIDSTKYSGIVMRDGKEIRLKGNRPVVWKRDFQGPWKILRNMWNRSEP